MKMQRNANFRNRNLFLHQAMRERVRRRGFIEEVREERGRGRGEHKKKKKEERERETE